MQDTLNIKRWYIQEYPTDTLGFEITNNITFRDAFRVLLKYEDFYSFINVTDSLVRERIFAKLAQIYNFDYEIIYNLWLKAVD